MRPLSSCESEEYVFASTEMFSSLVFGQVHTVCGYLTLVEFILTHPSCFTCRRWIDGHRIANINHLDPRRYRCVFSFKNRKECCCCNLCSTWFCVFHMQIMTRIKNGRHILLLQHNRKILVLN